MSNDEMTKNYLETLYQMTNGNLETQVSMHEVGERIGLEKSEAGQIAEELMVQGAVELKTLAGGIGITQDGLELLGISTSSVRDASDDTALQLSGELIATDQDRRTVEQLSQQLKGEICKLQLEYPAVEAVVIDLKSIELQLLSPEPKIGVLKELLRSLHLTLSPHEKNCSVVTVIKGFL